MNYYMYMYVVIIKLILAILLVALGDTDRLFKLLTIYLKNSSCCGRVTIKKVLPGHRTVLAAVSILPTPINRSSGHLASYINSFLSSLFKKQ